MPRWLNIGTRIHDNYFFLDAVVLLYRNPQTIEQLPYKCTFDSHYGKDPRCGFISDPNSVGKWATFSAGGTPVAGTGPPEAGNNGNFRFCARCP